MLGARRGQWDLDRKEGMQHTHWEGGGGCVWGGGRESEKEEDCKEKIEMKKGGDRTEIG